MPATKPLGVPRSLRLRVTVGDLVGGIERRQRGLDGQQEEVQCQIGELLQADWFGAVEQCQALLEAMAGTLQELNEVLLRDSSHIQALLQEVQQAAATVDATEAEEAAQRVGEQVDRMAAWGASRQQAWSGYYQYVHRFLRMWFGSIRIVRSASASLSRSEVGLHDPSP